MSAWTDITQVAAGRVQTVGLRSDGTVVAVGDNLCGQLNVTGWMDISQVAAGCLHTVGLKSDGTIVAVGRNFEGQCDVVDWQLSSSLPLMVDINPDILNLKSKGNYVTCYIELPEEYDPNLINIESVVIWEINGSAPNTALIAVGPFGVGDNNENGIPDLMVKFDRQQLHGTVTIGNSDITVYCETYDGMSFEGCDSILVVDKGKDHLSEDQSSVEY